MNDDEIYMTFMPIECPKCKRTIFVLAEDGTQDFECECGFKDTLTIKSME